MFAGTVAAHEKQTCHYWLANVLAMHDETKLAITIESMTISLFDTIDWCCVFFVAGFKVGTMYKHDNHTCDFVTEMRRAKQRRNLLHLKGWRDSQLEDHLKCVNCGTSAC